MKTMFDPDHEFFRALTQARTATRRGDLAAADKWMKLAERHVRLGERMIVCEKRRREVHGYINPVSPASAGRTNDVG